jgi:predicted acylesterase/phospholipase RssA
MSETTININPSRTCDIVMKGGITSGIVYPKAIYEIAKEYKFVNIGGTSAGAIAAALTAAAEYNRREFGSDEGFKKLNCLPDNLGEKINGKTKLLSLFQPDKSTKKTFNLFLNLAAKKTWYGKTIYALSSLIKNFPVAAVLSLLPGGAAAFYIYGKLQGILPLTIIFFSISICSLIGMIALTSYFFIKSLQSNLVKNNYGLTNGHSEENNPKEIPLTDWLADLIDEVAGKKDTPLTFKNLKDGKEPINLQVMTTNLTTRRPYSLPFENRTFFYSEDDFKKYFPKKVVEWMKSISTSCKTKDGIRHITDFNDVPIVVAARMSLSFPFLISAVPLYTIDYTLKSNQQKKKEDINEKEDEIEIEIEKMNEKAIPEKCLFSDGGICSNFPIHFFDCPIPGRPTFAFNLDTFHPDHPKDEHNEAENIYLPNTNNEGIGENWYRSKDSIFNFLKSILGTMQNWNDNSLFKMPGYRDRIVNIHLSPDEGGLNLNMDEEFIGKISKRGMYAGIKIRDRFTGEAKHDMDWNNHRWIRFRASLCMLEEYLEKFEKNYEKENPDIEMSYDKLLNRANNELPKSYRLKNSQKSFAINETAKLRKFIKELLDEKNSFCDNSPKPRPELKAKPRI